jgi:hypothetical protein
MASRSSRSKYDGNSNWTYEKQRVTRDLARLLHEGIKNTTHVDELRDLMSQFPPTHGGKFGAIHDKALVTLSILNAARAINNRWNVIMRAKATIGADPTPALKILSNEIADVLVRAAADPVIKNALDEGKYDPFLAADHLPESMDYSNIGSIQKLWVDLSILDAKVSLKGIYGDKAALEALGSAMNRGPREANRTLAKIGPPLGFSFGQDPRDLANAIASHEVLDDPSRSGSVNTGYMSGRNSQGNKDSNEIRNDSLLGESKSNQGGRRKKRKSRKKKKTKRKRKTKGKRKTKRKKSKKRRKTRKKQ